MANTLLQENTIPISALEGAAPIPSAQAIGTVIRLVLTDDNIANVVEAGYSRLVIERSEDGGISYDEISVPSERPVLDPTQPVMRFYDRGGDPSYYYRFRYVGTIAGAEELTDPSEAIEGVGLAIRGVLTAEQLKARYFFGVDITDDRGNPLADAVFEHYILSAIRWLEHQLDIPILPASFVERHDYHSGDQSNFLLIQLDNYPVLDVEEFRVQYPSGQSIIIFPNEWLRINNAEGHLQVVPTAGTLSQVLIGRGGTYLPAIYAGPRDMPQLFEIAYSAGFAAGKVPRNIIDIIGKFASLGPFNIFGDLIAGAGIANISLSMDGLSQSIGTTSSATNAGYGSRIIQYTKEIKDQIPILRRYYKGLRLAVA